ncbi:MAG: permease prefix domain 1-containing protein [Lachnospiraceae bacterium]|nr:permease prefix domain 1-containing protein [Lachnospiraceae bacterium]
MNEKIKAYFNQIFADAPRTRMALDLKQEMMQSAIDKYNDMVADGHAEEDAYQNVIASIGDVTELFPEVAEKNLLALPKEDRKKKALLTASAVGLYIFALAVFLFFGFTAEFMDYGDGAMTSIGFVLAIVICIPPTVMLVYAANMYPAYSKTKNQDMVERYKEVRYLDNKEKAVLKSVRSLIWSITVLLYFGITLLTWRAEVTWILFLIAACVQKIVTLVYELKYEEKHI